MKGWEVGTDVPLDSVLEWCVQEKNVDRLMLTARLDPYSKRKEALERPGLEEVVASLFGDDIRERKLVRRWPGTELDDAQAVVFVIAFDLRLIRPMAGLGPLLSHWRHSNVPPLPEDPCLFREGDDWPVLVSVTHEGDAWILSEERPPFCQGEPFDFKPENLLVPTAAEGFVGQ